MSSIVVGVEMSSIVVGVEMSSIVVGVEMSSIVVGVEMSSIVVGVNMAARYSVVVRKSGKRGVIRGFVFVVVARAICGRQVGAGVA